jgi:hypothetical protein
MRRNRRGATKEQLRLLPPLLTADAVRFGGSLLVSKPGSFLASAEAFMRLQSLKVRSREGLALLMRGCMAH